MHRVFFLMQLIDNLRSLVDTPSVTGEEIDILLLVEQMLASMGLVIERQQITDSRWNIFAGWGDTQPPVVFCTHLDTVPPFFPFTEEQDRYRGRGVCDAKASVAAMLEAGRKIANHGGHPAFLFVCGEETDSVGAKAASTSGRSAGHIIVGEPTDNFLATGHNGVLTATIHVQGRSAHSAYPDLGASAIHGLLDLLGECRQADWGMSGVLGRATINIGLLDGGVASNVLAPQAQATVMIRLVDSAVQREAQLKDIVGAAGECTIITRSEPQLLHTVPGIPLKPVAFGTDIPYLKPLGRMLLVGPGSIHEAHTSSESISLNDILQGVDTYERLYGALAQ
jgi:acetylornithine deacetylase